jgi:hypothetical protein
MASTTASARFGRVIAVKTDDERDLIRRMQGPIERLQAALHTLPDRGLSAMVAGQLQVAPSNKQ